MANIIIVDDERPIRRVMRQLLTIEGHDVLEAADGVEALEVMSGKAVSVAIVDLMMPRMNGIELIAEMRGRHPNVKVVVISAFTDVLCPTEEEPNIVGVLKKPFELKDLSDTVKGALKVAEGDSET